MKKKKNKIKRSKKKVKKKFFRKKSSRKKTSRKKTSRKKTSKKKYFKKTKKKNIRLKKIVNKKKFKIRKSTKKRYDSKSTILQAIRIIDKLKKVFQFNLNIDATLKNFFQGVSDKISLKVNTFKLIVEEEKQRKKRFKIKEMEQERSNRIREIKIEKQLAFEKKEQEYKEEIKLEKERKKDLHRFIRIEQAVVRKEQAEKQKKFLEQIKLEKKIEQFRKREALEIKNLEKFVLSQERESYSEVQDRIESIKQKYQALRDQKIRERIEELGIEVTDSDTRTELLEKERQYNLDRQKIEFALESYYRSMSSCVFQLNKRWIPKKMSLLRVLDYRFESSSIYIKFDEEEDSKWLMLVYIKDNNPDAGIIVEDKTNSSNHTSTEYKTNEIFKFSDNLVDSLTNLLDRERKKRITK
jgi:hypothetical protein